MKILIAEDDMVSRRLLESTLARWGYEAVVTDTGVKAWEALQEPDASQLALLDWMMPDMDGLQVCRLARATPATSLTYIILLTARGAKEDVVAGLEAGANDYVTKPFDREELRARLGVGIRVAELQANLAQRVAELQTALAEVKQLQGILPICSYCKSIRNDERFWQRVEDYIGEHAAVGFSHGICPQCWEKVVQPQMQELLGHRVPYEE